MGILSSQVFTIQIWEDCFLDIFWSKYLFETLWMSHMTKYQTVLLNINWIGDVNISVDSDSWIVTGKYRSWVSHDATPGKILNDIFAVHTDTNRKKSRNHVIQTSFKI